MNIEAVNEQLNSKNIPKANKKTAIPEEIAAFLIYNLLF